MKGIVFVALLAVLVYALSSAADKYIEMAKVTDAAIAAERIAQYTRENQRELNAVIVSTLRFATENCAKQQVTVVTPPANVSCNGRAF